MSHMKTVEKSFLYEYTVFLSSLRFCTKCKYFLNFCEIVFISFLFFVSLFCPCVRLCTDKPLTLNPKKSQNALACGRVIFPSTKSAFTKSSVDTDSALSAFSIAWEGKIRNCSSYQFFPPSFRRSLGYESLNQKSIIPDSPLPYLQF